MTKRNGETTYLFIDVNLVDLVKLEVAVGDPLSIGSFTSPLLVKKTHGLGKKSQASNAQIYYTFDVEKTEEFLVK